MTDEQLQQYCGQNVELSYRGETFAGKFACGAEAQVTLNAPYAVEVIAGNVTLGETTRVAIKSAEAVEWVRVLDEPLSADRVED